MNEQEIAELAAKVATEAVEKLKETDKKKIPIETDEVIVGKSPEEKLLEGNKGGFKSMGHFFTDLIQAETDEPSEALKNYSNALKKTAGYMEEGDLSQGGYGLNAHIKSCYMLETPKAFATCL